MNKYCLEHWDRNKGILMSHLNTKDEDYINELHYIDIVRMVFVYALSDESSEGVIFDVDALKEIDDGDYQGTLLYLIPIKTYQPMEHHYFMTFVRYGSCSGCDTLLEIKYNDKERMVKDIMTLCKDIVSNVIVPYNIGWREDDRFKEVASSF